METLRRKSSANFAGVSGCLLPRGAVPIKTVPEILLLGPREVCLEKNVVDEESQVFG